MVKLSSIKVTKPTASTFRGWAFVLVAGAVLATLALIDSGDLTAPAAPVADGSTGCQLTVAADELRVRSGPSAEAGQVRMLIRGDTVDATRVVTDGFRELEGGSWAADQFLTPVPGSFCG